MCFIIFTFSSYRNNSTDFAFTKHELVTELDNQVVNNNGKSY